MTTLPVSYTTVDLILLTFPPISQTALSSADLYHHAGQAEAFINARISRKYSIPITGVVPLLEVVATDLSIFKVLSSRISIIREDEELPFYRRFKGAMQILDDVAVGRIPLLDNAGAVLAGRSDIDEVYSNTMGYLPTFWEGAFEGQFVDGDKLDNEADRRGNTIVERLL